MPPKTFARIVRWRNVQGRRALGATGVYIEVDDLDAIAKKLPRDADIIVQRRTTFYGATEMILRDPAGNVVSFSQMS